MRCFLCPYILQLKHFQRLLEARGAKTVTPKRENEGNGETHHKREESPGLWPGVSAGGSFRGAGFESGSDSHSASQMAPVLGGSAGHPCEEQAREAEHHGSKTIRF